MALFDYLCNPVKIKRFILAVQISFLLTLFGATTFYFQYVSVRKAVEASAAKSQKSEKNSCSQPLTEEESEAQTNSEEEEQNDIRALHELKLAMSEITFSMISWATVHLSVFEEIHFEVITPPPQVA